MVLAEFVELKGRNGRYGGRKYRIGVWLAKKVLCALANEPQLRKELRAIVRAAKFESKHGSKLRP